MDAWAVAGLVVVAFVLRLALINDSLAWDDLYLYEIVHGHSLGEVLSAVHNTEKTPPLGFVLSWLLDGGGGPTALVRVPSLVGSLATVPLAYLVGRRTVGRAAGLFAAAWLAISPFELFYGTESRAYAQLTAWVLVSTLALLLALQSGRRRWWVLYAAATAAAIYTHYIAALSLVPQALWVLWRHRESYRPLLIANAAALLVWLPWLPSFLVQGDHSDAEAKNLAASFPLSFSTVTDLVPRVLAGHPHVPLDAIPGVLPGAVMIGVLLAAVLALTSRWATERVRPRPPREGSLIVALALVPLAGLILYSARPQHSFLVPRNLSAAVPYALLSAGWLVTAPRPRIAVPLAIIALAALGVNTARTFDPDNRRPNARAAARYIDAHAPPGVLYLDSEVLASDQAPAHAIRLYLKRPHRIRPMSLTTFLTVWRQEALRNQPVFTSSYVLPGAKPRCLPSYGARFRVVAHRVFRGLWRISVCWYAPERTGPPAAAARRAGG